MDFGASELSSTERIAEHCFGTLPKRTFVKRHKISSRRRNEVNPRERKKKKITEKDRAQPKSGLKSGPQSETKLQSKSRSKRFSFPQPWILTLRKRSKYANEVPEDQVDSLTVQMTQTAKREQGRKKEE